MGIQSESAYSVCVLIIALISILSTLSLVRKTDEATRKQEALELKLRAGSRFSSLDQLSAGIAHEINNPLGIMAQEAQLIRHLMESSAMRKVEDSGEVIESVGVIEAQVDRCKETVNKLLSLARQMKPVMQKVDINQLVETMIQIVGRDVSSKGITISKRLQPNLPLLYSDPTLLRQVILNLIVNASQAIEYNGKVTVSTLVTEHSLDIMVEDNGCGIPEQDINRVFTPFFSTKLQGTGTGLGLAICKGIIEKLGGTIVVASEAGTSTTFTVHLPINPLSEGAS